MEVHTSQMILEGYLLINSAALNSSELMPIKYGLLISKISLFSLGKLGI